MFFHGIQKKYLASQYPFNFPDAHVSTKNEVQLKDRKHLIERFGFEPVHLLESSADYPVAKCIKECSAFGDVIFVFEKLMGPLWQISDHEIGVPFLDLRSCTYIFIQGKETGKQLAKYFPGKTILLLTRKEDLSLVNS